MMLHINYVLLFNIKRVRLYEILSKLLRITGRRRLVDLLILDKEEYDAEDKADQKDSTTLWW